MEARVMSRQEGEQLEILERRNQEQILWHMWGEGVRGKDGEEVRGSTPAGSQRVLSEVECNEVEDGKGNETSMKGQKDKRLWLK